MYARLHSSPALSRLKRHTCEHVSSDFGKEEGAIREEKKAEGIESQFRKLYVREGGRSELLLPIETL